MQLPYWKQCSGAYAVLLTLVALILLYSLYLFTMFGMDNAVNHDLMNTKVINLPWLENCCSWWPVSHLILFFILGIMFPTCDFLVITAGILWELVEMIISKLLNRPRQAIRETEGIEYSSNWWAGSFKDILFNIVGFYLGKGTRLAYEASSRPLKRNYLQMRPSRSYRKRRKSYSPRTGSSQ